MLFIALYSLFRAWILGLVSRISGSHAVWLCFRRVDILRSIAIYKLQILLRARLRKSYGY
jgi:hypothetical protein